LRYFGVQNLFCVILECKIYFALFWSAKFILRGLDNSDLMTMQSIDNNSIDLYQSFLIFIIDLSLNNVTR